ncbi:MAG: hypothetical protein A3G25_21785 [Betaproteobacteria bacterium RIFCSPLOWO2_12_FULL_63_13]|nr:MAG: hypothetical protein A3G25_21785 [Betaproteobacteria bacterium RIFCSPLOWO2_12_FULL_63_13]
MDADIAEMRRFEIGPHKGSIDVHGSLTNRRRSTYNPARFTAFAPDPDELVPLSGNCSKTNELAQVDQVTELVQRADKQK